MHRVLVAGDQPEIRRLWSVNLSARGLQVMEAADGAECLRLVRSEIPDVVVLDISMPGVSGWEVLQAVKGDPTTASIPVIVVTGLVEGDTDAKAQALGAFDVIFKPFGIDRLLESIDEALKQR